MNYYNENDKFCAEWLRNLIREGLIPKGLVDDRSITEVTPADLAGFRQCHFFAGVGGWSIALGLAGVSPDVELWTGSAPCQPWSSAGKQQGFDDERHLWPQFFALIQACRPALCMGEQVPDAIRHGWLDRVFDDLEGAAYTCWAIDLPACSAGSPTIRQRLFWMADANNARPQERPGQRSNDESQLAATERASRKSGFWSRFDILPCSDGNARRVEPGSFPLAHGLPRSARGIVARLCELGVDPKAAKRIVALAKRNRVGQLRGYGNAIVPQAAAEFVKSYLEGVTLKD